MGLNGTMAETEIEIHTGLDTFVMLDTITGVSATKIGAIRVFCGTPVYMGLEALAQLGAFHIRHLTGFERHIFLLKIGICRIPPGKPLDG